MIEFAAPARDTAEAPASLAAPLDGVVIRWSPVVGRDERPIGFRLRMRGRAQGASVAALLDAVLAGFTDEASGMPQGLVLLAPQDVPADTSLAFWGAPRNVLLECDEHTLDDPAQRELVASAQKHGVRLALRAGGPVWPPADRLAPFQYLVSPVETAVGAGKPPRDVALLATGAVSRVAVQKAMAAGANGVVGWPNDPPAGNDGLKPQQRALLNLVRLVQADADTAEVEKEFKREPMLAYMLLTLANSPAFMRSTPIASLSHAIQLLGYQRLVKWLVLLLVIASKDGKALPAIYTAVLRGLLLENCAAAAGAAPTVRDQCFVVGAFSLLDRITGRSLVRLTQDVPLPEAVATALTGAGGPYAGWLALACAVEDGEATSDHVAAAAAPLKLSLGQVNAALLRALATNDALQTLV
ncbi:MAG: HDOD domain-containing protein [Burkholderiaceae bacterium]|nr:HDOD domain-containing protein [Burkholderiaceae bacterium]